MKKKIAEKMFVQQYLRLCEVLFALRAKTILTWFYPIFCCLRLSTNFSHSSMCICLALFIFFFSHSPIHLSISFIRYRITILKTSQVTYDVPFGYTISFFFPSLSLSFYSYFRFFVRHPLKAKRSTHEESRKKKMVTVLLMCQCHMERNTTLKLFLFSFALPEYGEHRREEKQQQ